jgi:hypothetical protein
MRSTFQPVVVSITLELTSGLDQARRRLVDVEPLAIEDVEKPVDRPRLGVDHQVDVGCRSRHAGQRARERPSQHVPDRCAVQLRDHRPQRAGGRHAGSSGAAG